MLTSVALTFLAAAAFSGGAAHAKILKPTDGVEYVDALATTNRFCPVRCASEILQPESTQELAEWMRTQKSSHDHITVKGGGHSYGCQSVPEDGGMMIHTGLLDKAEVVVRDDGTAFARLGAGLVFQDVVPQLNRMGYSMPHGECITVGLGGWLLNSGGHPETMNFARYYQDKPFLSKITGVDYDGNVFTVDEGGLNYTSVNEAMSDEARAQRIATTALLGGAYEQGLLASGTPVSPAASTSMRVMQRWGANVMIATEFEIELVKRAEPDYFALSYPIEHIKNDETLLQQIVDFTMTVNEEDLSCGLSFMTDMLPDKMDALIIKCIDWKDQNGAILKAQAPKGHTKFKRVPFSAFFTWNKDSYGMGWTPQFFYEPIPNFLQGGGVEAWRQVMIKMSERKSPCKSCMTELNAIPSAGLFTFDMMCGSGRKGQNRCSDFTFEMQKNMVGDRFKLYKQNLPSCRANSKWEQEMIEYGQAYPIASQLKQAWDSENFVDFWLGINHDDNSQECEATHIVEAGATCKANGIGPHHLVKAIKRDAKQRCPKVFEMRSATAQNIKCGKRWERNARDLPLIYESEC